jgi:hypothetical protein
MQDAWFNSATLLHFFPTRDAIGRPLSLKNYYPRGV